jgi:hypothetical protein
MLSWSWRSIKLLLLHLVGVPNYLTYNDDARSHTNKKTNDIFLMTLSLNGIFIEKHEVLKFTLQRDGRSKHRRICGQQYISADFSSVRKVDWRQVAQGRVQLRALVNTVTILRVPENARNFFTRWEPVSLSRRTVFHGVGEIRTHSWVASETSLTALRMFPIRILVRQHNLALVQRNPAECGVSGNWVWSWILDNEEALAHWGCCAMVKKIPRPTRCLLDRYE